MGSSMNGTCYTAAECTSKGGTNGGTCAGGYGICCIFSLGCGGTSSQNNTFLQSNSATPASGTCLYTICPCNNNICQLRLDFNTFVIAGPSTSTNFETRLLNGAPEPQGTGGAGTFSVRASFGSRCLTDTFEVTNSGGLNPPVICGINTGEHMYVDVDRETCNGCNELAFTLGSAPGIFTTIPTRMWNIRVTQISCDSLAKAPSGCTQYFTAPTATVRTYNFAGGEHLAFQRQTICVRRAAGTCRICWSANLVMDFEVSGNKAPVALTTSTICCGGGNAMGLNVNGYDCLQIPGALKATVPLKVSAAMLKVSRFCGRDAGLASSMNSAPTTVCSTVTPFYIRFISDGYETNMELRVPAGGGAVLLSKGVQLTYFEDANNCT